MTKRIDVKKKVKITGVDKIVEDNNHIINEAEPKSDEVVIEEEIVKNPDQHLHSAETATQEDRTTQKEARMEKEVQKEGANVGSKFGVNLADFEGSKSVSKSVESSNVGKGFFSLINNKNGMRLTLPESTWETLELSDIVQISIAKPFIAIGGELPNCEIEYNLKPQKSTRIVYNADLVREITKTFDLDYTKRSSMTFYDGDFDDYEGSPVLIVKMTKEGE